MNTVSSTTPRAGAITALGAAQIAREIAAGALSAQEAVEAFIRRIEAVNPRLNAVVVPLFEQARAEAAAADAKQARGVPLGPLHGVPVSIKESYHVAGTPSTGGVPQWADHSVERDGPLVARLRAAGAIVLGKTNVPELLFYLESDNPVYGRANNPWNPDRSPGGSSGGEGALVAASGSAMGLGSDLGGSIRVPAHCCGIHGFKPTSGRLTMRGTFDETILPGQEAIVGQPGPLARRVEDLSLAMRILTAPGRDHRDPTIPPVPWRDPSAVSVSGLRVGFYTDDGFITPAPALRRAVEEAAAALRDRGAHVDAFRPPDVTEAMRLFFGLLSADGGASARRALGPGPHDRRIRDLVRLARLPGPLRAPLAALLKLAGQERLAMNVRTTRRISSDRYWQLIAACTAYRARFLDVLDADGFDILLCPPSAHPAVTHGSSYYLTAVASYSMLYNLLGMPAGIVAATRVRAGEEQDGQGPTRDVVERAARAVEAGSAGLPVGVQVVARHWRDDVALAVMAALEEHFRAQPDYPEQPPL